MDEQCQLCGYPCSQFLLIPYLAPEGPTHSVICFPCAEEVARQLLLGKVNHLTCQRASSCSQQRL